MATMTIRITVQAKGITWSRTATVEVDTAQFTQGNAGGAYLFGAEGTANTVGQYSYSGIAVGVFANKAKGSMVSLIASTSSADLGGHFVKTHLPFIFYSGAGGGMTGAMNASSTSTDLPSEDVNSLKFGYLLGTLNIHALTGLKAIS